MSSISTIRETTWCQGRGGILFVVSGPSGVGKDTVLSALRSQAGAPRRCVTATTRLPRDGEQDGVDYHFLQPIGFQALRDSGGLLEVAEVHGNWYGVPRAQVESELTVGRDVLLKIDVQGGATIREMRPDSVSIFLMPPSWQELERRLRERATDGEAAIQRRLEDAVSELERRWDYTYWVVNADVEEAASRIMSVVEAERCRGSRWKGMGGRTAVSG